MSPVVLLLLAAAPPLTWSDALARCDAAGDLAGLTAERDERRAGLSQLPSLTSNPQVLLQPGVRTEGGTTGPEGQLTVQQSFNLGGLGNVRREVVGAEADQLDATWRLARQSRRFAVAQAWLQLRAAERSVDLAHAEELAAADLVTHLERALGSGGATRVELATARAFRAEAVALRLDWEGRRAEAGAELARLLGLDDFVRTTGELPVFDAPSERRDGAELPLKVLDAEAETERKRMAESAAQWSPQLQLSVQAGHDAPSQWFANAGVGLTLPVFERGNRERTVHRAALSRLEAERELTRARITLAIRLAEHEVEHTSELLKVLLEQQVPAAMEAAALETKRFAQGESTLFEVTVLRRQALQGQLSAVAAEANALSARFRLAELEVKP